MGLLSSVPDHLGKFQSLTESLQPCCGEGLCQRHIRDELYRKPMVICWSLKESKDFSGPLPEQNEQTKALVMAEAILFHERDKHRDEYERFRA